MLEEELRTTRNDLSTERRHKRRLEKLIKDCTIAIRMVLRVCSLFYLRHCNAIAVELVIMVSLI